MTPVKLPAAPLTPLETPMRIGFLAGLGIVQKGASLALGGGTTGKSQQVNRLRNKRAR